MMQAMSEPGGDASFLTTQWSLVRHAASRDPAAARDALQRLCSDYWYPLYAFVRRKGVGAQDAEDVVQSFFAHLIDGGGLDHVARHRGRFRSFLLASVQNHLANERASAAALKRGGDVLRMRIDFEAADRRFELESRADDPARAFQRAWALELLSHTLKQLEAEYRASDRGGLFDELKVELTAGEGPGHAVHAARLGCSDAAVKVAVHRLRRRFAERLRAAIAATVDDESDVDAEIGELFRSLGQ